ncbi:hypothetical protein D3C85_1823480 [compost metagenome]
MTGDPITLPDSIRNDMRTFLEHLAKEEINLKDIGLKGSLELYVERLALSFGVK